MKVAKGFKYVRTSKLRVNKFWVFEKKGFLQPQFGDKLLFAERRYGFVFLACAEI